MRKLKDRAVVLVLFMIVILAIGCVLWLFTYNYRECRAHGFSWLYCFWTHIL